MSSGSFNDFFADSSSWRVFASGQAEGKLSAASGPDGKPALRLDYDFHDGGGFVVARKEIQFLLPETFEVSFALRGAGLANNLEFKIADPGGTNAWRNTRENFLLPENWQDLRIRERDLPFAWGPAGGGAPKVVGAVEFVVAAGPGGSGSVWLSDLALDDQTLYQPTAVTASSHRFNSTPESVFEPGSPSGWQAEENDPKPQWIVDFGRLVRFGGMVLVWPTPTLQRTFDIEISNDGESWSRIHHATHALGHRSHVPAPGAEARWLRMNFANSESASLVSLDLRPDAFSQTPNEFIHAVAVDFSRGWFPRYWYREQSYWTPVGSPEGRRRALINEEGLVEVDEADFSLEPFLEIGGKFITWADAETQLEPLGDGLPLPAVTWTSGTTRLTVLPWVEGFGENLVLHVTYRVSSGADEDVRLIIAARPYQVNPPWQAFRNLGGRSPIHRISCEEDGMSIGGRRVSCSVPSNNHGAAAFEEGGVVEYLSRGEMPPRVMIDDESGLASAAMSWQVPNDSENFEITLTVPFFQPVNAIPETGRDAAQKRWEETLGTVKWDVPASARDAFTCFHTTAAHILINRDGPAIQPGPRRYTRSWVRDCVIMGAALAKAGLLHALRDFLLWYVQFQRDDGFIPCVVDRDGVDPLVEHDSHGQFLWGIREVFRADGDPAFLETMRTPVQRAAEFLIRLRGERMTEKYRETAHEECFGLLPESASHEGYLAHPVHSYWDDFWGIRGLEAAADIAESLALTDESIRYRSAAVEFRDDVMRSLEKVIENRQLEYIPGSVEWADFDPTATSNAIAMLDFADALPSQPLQQMLETYLDGFRRKRSGAMPWNNYTAYEIRIIGAMVRLGRRDDAHELLEFFLSDRRPLEWNQWPEISWRDPRAPGHLGDVPHTWIAAEYLLALASMVASERDHTSSMVLAAGLSWDWISLENGVSVSGLPTRFGILDFHISADEQERITIHVGGSLTLPPGGLTIEPPLLPGRLLQAAVDSVGKPVRIEGNGRSVVVESIPFSTTLHLHPPSETLV